MIYALLGFMALALFHFIYESIIAPSVRLALRYELFRLRDELRSLKMSVESELEDRHYHYLQDSINSMVSLVHRLDIETLNAIMKEILRDKELQKTSQKRQRALDDCAVKAAHDIWKRTVRVAMRAFAVNSFGWAPIAIPAFAILSAVKKRVKQDIKSSISLPEPRLKKVVPDDASHLGLAA